MQEEGYKTLAIIMMAVILAIIIVNPTDSNVIYENTNATTDVGEPYVVSNLGKNDIYPDIKDNLLAFINDNSGNQDVLVYNVETKSTDPVASLIYHEYQPSAHENDVVWYYNDGSLWKLAGFNLDTFSTWEYALPAGVSVTACSVWNGVVYYYAYSGDKLCKYDIYTDTNTDLVGDDSIFSAGSIDVYDDILVISGTDMSQIYSVWYYKNNALAKLNTLTTGGNGKIHDGKIVYRDFDTTKQMIKTKDLNTGVTTTIADSTTHQPSGVLDRCAVYGDWVAYVVVSGSTGNYNSAILARNIKTGENVTIDSALGWARYLGQLGIDMVDNVVYYTKPEAPASTYHDIWACQIGEAPEEDDIDGDGMPDEWEQQIIDDDPDDDIEDIYDVEPDDDYDEDGYTNKEEYQNDTDPCVPDEPEPEPDPIGDNLTWIVLAIVAVAILIGLEVGYFKSRHIRAINEKVPIGIVISIIAIALIVVYLVIA